MAARTKLRLLVVEDREVMLKIIRRLLVEIGFADIDGAANGVAALARLKEKTYDLILSDWNMDEMSGFELLRHVRADPAHAGIPFLLVTSEAKPENVLAAKAAGASGYLLKPFKLDTLRQAIDDVLAAKGFVSSVSV